MPQLAQKACLKKLSVHTYGWSDPNYKKASLLKRTNNCRVRASKGGDFELFWATKLKEMHSLFCWLKTVGDFNFNLQWC